MQGPALKDLQRQLGFDPTLESRPRQRLRMDGCPAIWDSSKSSERHPAHAEAGRPDNVSQAQLQENRDSPSNLATDQRAPWLAAIGFRKDAVHERGSPRTELFMPLTEQQRSKGEQHWAFSTPWFAVTTFDSSSDTLKTTAEAKKPPVSITALPHNKTGAALTLSQPQQRNIKRTLNNKHLQSADCPPHHILKTRSNNSIQWQPWYCEHDYAWARQAGDSAGAPKSQERHLNGPEGIIPLKTRSQITWHG